MRPTPRASYSEQMGNARSGTPSLRPRRLRHAKLALDLLLWDVLLAFAMWQAAYLFQAAVGYGALFSPVPSEVATSALAPSVIIWVGMRTGVGLYPGIYSGGSRKLWPLGPMSRMTELSRQAFALGATVAVIAAMEYVSAVRVLSGFSMMLFWWALGLLVAAPVLRHYVRD